MYMEAIAAAAEAAPVITKPAERVPGLVLHVDGDYLAYFASGNDETEPGIARLTALGIIERFRSAVGADKIVVHNTAKGCHKGERYLVATVKPYQGQRDTGRKPKNHGYLQSFLMDYKGDAFLSKTWATREADDGIGACALYAVGSDPGYIAIATADKDMRMLPGAHVNWRNPQIVTTVSPGAYEVLGADEKVYGLKWFWLQMLMGDAADNCPGLETYRTYAKGGGWKWARCGEKTAESLLEGVTSSDEACRDVITLYRWGYEQQGETFAMDRFVEQAALLWMRTDQNATLLDFATNTGPSCINRSFTQPVWDAVERLSQRVQSARQQINSFGG